MQITFDTENFRNHEQGLISVLSHLNYSNAYSPVQHDDIETITCRTPSLAYKYTRYVAKQGISPKAEKVFLKNPGIAVRYLQYIERDHFADPSVQTKFHKKLIKSADLSFHYCKSFNKRLAEGEEEVFLKCMSSMKNYAIYVIKGAFPEKVHNMIVLKSYEDLAGYEKHALTSYLKFADTGKLPEVQSPFR